MRYRFFTTSESAWKGMFAAIVSARESIYFGMYVFENTTHGYDFFSELKRKAKEGVRVVVILDVVGSAALPQHAIDQLRIAGAEVLMFSHWFRRMHQKLLIIDESVAFVGGVNIGGRYAKWRDLHMRLTGAVVHPMLATFKRMYRDCGGRDPRLLDHIVKKELLQKTKLWFASHTPLKKHNSLKKQYEEHINKGVRSIILVTPYFAPHRWLIAHLHQAMLRGVHVEIIVPLHTDYWSVDQVNYYYLDIMRTLGATCRLAHHMNHAKAMLIDETTGVVGSQNMDALSFNWNEEAGVFFEDEEMVRDLIGIVSNWRSDSSLFAPTIHLGHWYTRLLAFLLSSFQPIL